MPQAILGTTLQHFDRAAARMMAGQVKEVKGSHFVVMERPGLIANELHDMLSTL
eukprot:m.74773 g.74773  ORF g.74773 m.74773 type:complete len:54 (+) comp14378_c0_seq3:129-290(+)